MSAHKPAVSRLIEEHRALKRAGVTSFVVRQRMIMLAHLRKENFEAWVEARAQMRVLDVIEADGEEMGHLLTKDRGAFRRDEITLVQPRETKEAVNR